MREAGSCYAKSTGRKIAGELLQNNSRSVIDLYSNLLDTQTRTP